MILQSQRVTPKAFKTLGACSLEEPQPKFSAGDYKIAGFYFGCKIRIERLEGMCFHFVDRREKQILRCNDLVGIHIRVKFEYCSHFWKSSLMYRYLSGVCE